MWPFSISFFYCKRYAASNTSPDHHNSIPMAVLGRGEIGDYGSLIHDGFNILNISSSMHEVAIISAVAGFSRRHNAIADSGDFYCIIN